MKKHLIALGIAMGALLASPVEAAVVSITPSVTNVVTGGTFSLDVNISGLTASELVSVFDLNIYFNPAVLQGLGFTLGADLGGLWDASSSVVAADSYDLFAMSLTYDPNLSQSENDDALAALQADGSFTLLTLDFKAIGAGVSNVAFGLGLNERDVVGRDAQFLTGLQFNGACVAANRTANDGNFSCNNVPEPASYGLLGVALLGAALPSVLRRRREQQR